MELSDLSRLVDAQEAGHTFELRDPVLGQPTGIKLTIAGPDSNIRKMADAAMVRANTVNSRRGAEFAQQQSQKVMDDAYFAVTIDWEITEDGEPVPFTRENFQRFLDAGSWVRAQIEMFSGDRTPYFKAAY